MLVSSRLEATPLGGPTEQLLRDNGFSIDQQGVQPLMENLHAQIMDSHVEVARFGAYEAA